MSEASMNIVVDANVFDGYYRQDVLGEKAKCRGNPEALFARLGQEDYALIDDRGMIEGEWSSRAPRDQEWFNHWLAERFAAGDIGVVEIEMCEVLLSKLKNDCGFPKESRDKWYVRTAHTQAGESGQAVAIVTDDVDFFEPSAKAHPKKRERHLRDGRGKVATLLRKHDVDPRTSSQHPK
jgi:hypothetical protein